jgi:hypothetical protein
MQVKRLRSEDGYTMLAVIGAIALITVLVSAAVAATNGDLGLTKRNLDEKRAYAAAQAGIADYAFHLNDDNGYWKRCTAVPAPNAVNLQGANPLKTRQVPGATGDERYAIELLRSSSTAQNCNANNPPYYNMLEQSGTYVGTFRIRSTGYSGDAKRSIVATFKKAGFLDYVYFTEYETSDPVTYGYANPSPEFETVSRECATFRRDGRPRATSTRDWCNTIVFVDDDDIDGPMHTNDDFCINPGDEPNFGRSATDAIEVGAPSPGYHSSSSSGNGCTGPAEEPGPGTFITDADILEPPPTNADLKTYAGPPYTYTGQTRIELSGTNMRVNGGSLVPIPPGGVIYVQNDPSTACSTNYSPFNVTYPASSPCGNAIVRSSGSYSGQLTIAAQNDIIIDGSLVHSGNGLLGLIANNFVRVKHPCEDDVDLPGSLSDPVIDAAILAIDHSFIVDHYNCGDDDNLGTLRVNGSIAQKFRGAVGTTRGTGYTKDYNYDDRLLYQEPPHFFDPVTFAWHVGRQTLDFPAPSQPTVPG